MRSFFQPFTRITGVESERRCLEYMRARERASVGNKSLN